MTATTNSRHRKKKKNKAALLILELLILLIVAALAFAAPQFKKSHATPLDRSMKIFPMNPRRSWMVIRPSLCLVWTTVPTEI